MFAGDYRQNLYEDVGWEGDLDPCCNSIGTNAQGPLIYSAIEDGLLQLEYLLGQKIICNPAFPLCDEFLKLLEAAKEQQPLDTKALAILPHRDTNDWFKNFVARNKWRVVRRYPEGTKLFSEPSHANGFALKRRQTIDSGEVILACEVKTPGKEEHKGHNLEKEIQECVSFIKYGYRPPQ